MEQIRMLLTEVGHVVDTDKKIKREKYQCGEFFNVFNILGLSTNETRTHSAFIAEMLNPKGSHGCGIGFLNEFVQRYVNKSFSNEDLEKADIKVELSIGNKNEDETEGGRIDIAIFIGKYLIIIENKIYASDQKNQLVRYNNYARALQSNGVIEDFNLLYLTLFGYEASEFSTKNELVPEQDYFTLSYSKDIIKWLDSCKAIAVEKPLVRETIIQYNNLLKEITYQDMDSKQQEQMFAVMAEYPEATASIFHTGITAFRNYVFHNFCTPLFMIEAEKRGLIFEESNMLSGEKYAGFQFKREEWDSTGIRVESDGRYDKNFFIAIRHDGKTKLNKQGQKLDCFDGTPVNNCVFGWSWLTKYRDWYSDILIDLKNGEYCAFIMEKVDEILREIDEKKLIS